MAVRVLDQFHFRHKICQFQQRWLRISASYDYMQHPSPVGQLAKNLFQWQVLVMKYDIQLIENHEIVRGIANYAQLCPKLAEPFGYRVLDLESSR